ncbi:MAG: SRPBCC family protein [Candidatus Sulfotelmatobacter sp.]|jgi:uncharacterized protein YndB with AHSA1/START domain
MILRIVAIVAVLIAGVLLYAASKPNTFLIQRSITINAPPDRIFALVNDFHNWSVWAPQDKDDPTLTRTYSGPVSGKGAVSEWIGSGSSGRGRMSIVESQPPRNISVKVDFVKPFEAHNVNDFTIEPQGTLTTVTWRMQGTNVYAMKVMSIFLNMDRFMGKHFEAGLANLKAAAER